MKPGFRALLVGSLAWFIAGSVYAFDDAFVANVKYPSWFKPTFYDLRDDLIDAEAAGKRGLLLFFSTQGCSYCQLMLQKTFGKAEFAERLSAQFDVIGLEMFDDTEITDWQGKNQPTKDFAVREGAQFSPTLIFCDLRGERLLRLIGYYEADRLSLALDYLADPARAEASFDQWLARRFTTSQASRYGSAPELRADPIFVVPPFQLDRSRGKAEQPLLVIFERRDCLDCLAFHQEVLGDRNVRDQLSTFEVVRLDGDDSQTSIVTPTGNTTTPAQWMGSLGFNRLPAMVLFDENGTRVLQTDAVVFKGRFLNALGYLRNGAYAKGWTYQRYARSEGIRRLNEKRNRDNNP